MSLMESIASDRKIDKLKQRIADAAMAFCIEDTALRAERRAWSKLKSDHDEGNVCLLPYGNPEDPCEACKEYQATSRYKGSLHNRQRAKRKMMTAYSRIEKIMNEATSHVG